MQAWKSSFSHNGLFASTGFSSVKALALASSMKVLALASVKALVLACVKVLVLASVRAFALHRGWCMGNVFSPVRWGVCQIAV